MKHYKIFFILLVFSMLIGVVHGQSSTLEQNQKNIEDSAKNLQESVDKARGFTQEDYWQNIGSQWKEILLKNKLIAGLDSFFTKINLLFIILFGMDWSLSFNMLFAFLFWIFTFFSILKYFSSIGKSNIGLLYSFIGVILLAQINFFEYIGKWSVALVFYKTSILWRSVFFIFLIGLYVVWMLVHKSVADWLKKRKENKKYEGLMNSVQKTERLVTAIGESAAEATS
jgi:hypothetical protein